MFFFARVPQQLTVQTKAIVWRIDVELTKRNVTYEQGDSQRQKCIAATRHLSVQEMGSESCSTPNGSDMLSVAECELLNFGKDGQTTLTSLPDDYEEGLCQTCWRAARQAPNFTESNATNSLRCAPLRLQRFCCLTPVMNNSLHRVRRFEESDSLCAERAAGGAGGHHQGVL